MNKLIIGLHGPIGVGKSSVAKLLAEAHGLGDIISFAQPIRDMLEHGLGIPKEAMSDRELKHLPIENYGKSARQMMQTLGTEWGRVMVCPDIWVNAWTLKARDSNKDLIICDDVRFMNEIEAIDNMDGVIVKVVRDGIEVEDFHASEGCGLLPFDIEYSNNVLALDNAKFLLKCCYDLSQAKRGAHDDEGGS